MFPTFGGWDLIHMKCYSTGPVVKLNVITPCGTSAVVPLRQVVARCDFLAPRVGVYRHQCVWSSNGGVVSVPWLQWGCGISSSSVDVQVFFIVVGLWVPPHAGGGGCVWLMLLRCAWLRRCKSFMF